jgi:hypothetical protein
VLYCIPCSRECSRKKDDEQGKVLAEWHGASNRKNSLQRGAPNSIPPGLKWIIISKIDIEEAAQRPLSRLRNDHSSVINSYVQFKTPWVCGLPVKATTVNAQFKTPWICGFRKGNTF